MYDVKELLEIGPSIINIGVRDFGESVKKQGVEVTHLEWEPPIVVDQEIADILDELL
ncbi:unnamed protein product [marine sediment metagenome]|uniref:FdrA domain protein n=1 Tax=marine sediment metagenome TaxID=412755 RepID=X0XGQ8_9ZZZZ